MALPDSLKGTLHAAAFENNVAECKRLIAAKACGKDQQDYVNQQLPDGHGARPLHWAVVKDSLAALKCLVEAGAGINERTYCGESPLALACVSGGGGGKIVNLGMLR